MTRPTARRSSTWAAALLCAFFLCTSPVRAQVVTDDQLERLRHQAVSDPVALEKLRRIDSVEGRPVDLERALSGAQGTELRDRLDALAQIESGDPLDTSTAKSRAEAILSSERFRAAPPPRPFAGLAERLEQLTAPIERWFARLARNIPGGGPTLWLIVAIAVVVLAVLAALRAAARRTAGATRSPREQRRQLAEAGALERAADEAERRGDLQAAVRLRFRAGLYRLAEKGVIESPASRTSAEVARTLRSQTFDSLRAAFDEIVYGGRRPTRDDVAAAKTGWRRLQAEVATR